MPTKIRMRSRDSKLSDQRRDDLLFNLVFRRCQSWRCPWLLTITVMGLHFAVVTSTASAETRGVTVDHCFANEPFEASCLKHEVIVMTSAIYGRMERCMESEALQLVSAFGNDPKFLGCYEDVLHIMDKKCSGKTRCDVRAHFDNDFVKLKPCHDGLKMYLEASYNCVTVIEEDRSCSVAISSNSLHIMHSSSSSSKLSCGTKSQPWRLEAPAGQQINVSLLDFGSKVITPAEQSQERRGCQRYGHVVDKAMKRNITICGHQVERNSVVHKSFQNSIELVLDSDTTKDGHSEQDIFLIGFQAVGCSNLVPPEDTWLRRNDNEAVVGCYSSHQTWHLRCSENHWIGMIGNCTRDIVRPEAEEVSDVKFTSSMNINQVVIITVILVLTIIICFVIICTAAVCLKRHYAASARKYFQRIDLGCKKLDSYNGQFPNQTLVLDVSAN